MSDRRTVVLPTQLEPLRPLAYNLRWSWNRPARELFRRIDPPLWDAVGHNPVRLLEDADPARLDELAGDDAYVQAVGAAARDLDGYLAEKASNDGMRIAYFSAEFAVTECLRIFSGGLGVLAGDHLKSASDLGLPLVGVGLFYREGYFAQRIDAEGRQHAAYPPLDPERLPLTLERDGDGSPLEIRFPLEERDVHARIWRADVGRVPLYLLDTDVEANAAEDRRITDRLYGGGPEQRIRQEIALGIGGIRALDALGREPTVVHLNEGHAAFAAVERAIRAVADSGDAFAEAAERTAASTVFTTHTPVPAGHDRFAMESLERFLRPYLDAAGAPWDEVAALGRREADGMFGMTTLALRLSERRNGVSRLHGEVTRRMWHSLWPDRAVEEIPIGHVTNGVHMPTWVSPVMARLYAEHIGPDWASTTDPEPWRGATAISDAELWSARRTLRAQLVTYVRRRLAAQAARRGEETAWTAAALDEDALTIVFARRFATYKRAALLLSDIGRLERLLGDSRRLQFVFAGKAHPKDEPGQAVLQRIAAFAARPEFRDRFVLLEDYDVDIARHLVYGADVWLNVPILPHEASGTSGMKAAANGGLNLSIPDGWWAEAWTDHNRLDAPIGWSIQTDAPAEERDRADAERLYELLETEVAPLFHQRDAHGRPAAWLDRVRAAVSQLVPYFSTRRMVSEYDERAYRPAHRQGIERAGLAGSAREA